AARASTTTPSQNSVRPSGAPVSPPASRLACATISPAQTTPRATHRIRYVRLARAYRCNRGATALTLSSCANGRHPRSGSTNRPRQKHPSLRSFGRLRCRAAVELGGPGSVRGGPMDNTRDADALVIFGITGDLAKVMTFQALYRLEMRSLLNCPIIG